MAIPVTVYIVDDDFAVRDGFTRLLRSAGMNPKPYAKPESFLAEANNAAGACVLLDMTMPGMTGPQLQARLNTQGITLPVIAVSAREDDYIRTCAHELGARMFLRKPVDDQALLDAINWVVSSEGRLG